MILLSEWLAFQVWKLYSLLYSSITWPKPSAFKLFFWFHRDGGPFVTKWSYNSTKTVRRLSPDTLFALWISSLILPIQESVCTISPDLLSPRLATQIKLQITHTNSLVDITFHAYLVQDALQIPQVARLWDKQWGSDRTTVVFIKYTTIMRTGFEDLRKMIEKH